MPQKATMMPHSRRLGHDDDRKSILHASSMSGMHAPIWVRYAPGRQVWARSLAAERPNLYDNAISLSLLEGPSRQSIRGHGRVTPTRCGQHTGWGVRREGHPLPIEGSDARYAIVRKRLRDQERFPQHPVNAAQRFSGF